MDISEASYIYAFQLRPFGGALTEIRMSFCIITERQILELSIITTDKRSHVCFANTYSCGDQPNIKYFDILTCFPIHT